MSQSPSASFSYQEFSSDDEEGDYTAWDVGLYHSVAFAFPLSVSASGGVARTAFASDTLGSETTVYFELAPGYLLFDAWDNTLTVGGSSGGSAAAVADFTRREARHNDAYRDAAADYLPFRNPENG